MRVEWQIWCGLIQILNEMSLQFRKGSLLKYFLMYRGAGYQFGAQIVEKFLHVNKMAHILRAHQLCNEGYQV
jgi:diadenosine tetraphosphatase ApaH/serine/threonine PP2A family protein phosphatase